MLLTTQKQANSCILIITCVTGFGISNGTGGWHNICIFTPISETTGIYTVKEKFRTGELHGKEKFRFVELHGKRQTRLMRLDGRELNTLQKCKLERPIKIAGLEQFGSKQDNPKASSGPSCF